MTKEVTKVAAMTLEKARANAVQGAKAYGDIIRVYAALITKELGEGWYNKSEAKREDVVKEQKAYIEAHVLKMSGFKTMAELIAAPNGKAIKAGRENNARAAWGGILKQLREKESRGAGEGQDGFIAYTGKRLTAVINKALNLRYGNEGLGVEESEVLNAIQDMLEKNPKVAKALKINFAALEKAVADKKA